MMVPPFPPAAVPPFPPFRLMTPVPVVLVLPQAKSAKDAAITRMPFIYLMLDCPLSCPVTGRLYSFDCQHLPTGAGTLSYIPLIFGLSTFMHQLPLQRQL